MRRSSLCAVLAFGMCLVTAGNAPAQEIANLRGDFMPGAAKGNTTQSGQHPDGLPDAGGTGVWNYYTSDSSDPATWKLTLLTWDRTWKPAAFNMRL